MKRTLLALTAIASLATSGIATVFADKATTSPGPETLRAQGGAMTDMDEVGVDDYGGAGNPSETFRRLDINQDRFLNAQELEALSGVEGDAPEEGAHRLVDRLDENDDDVVSPIEFEKLSSAQ